MLAGEGPNAMLIAGGTDLLPNMKRRQQAPQVLVSLSRVEAHEEGCQRQRPDAGRRVDADRGHRHRRRAREVSRPVAGGVAGRDRAPAQHGHARRQSLPRHALQLLRPELRVAQGDRLLPEEGRRDLLGRDGEQALRCRVVDRLRAGAARARGEGASRVAARASANCRWPSSIATTASTTSRARRTRS